MKNSRLTDRRIQLESEDSDLGQRELVDLKIRNKINSLRIRRIILGLVL